MATSFDKDRDVSEYESLAQLADNLVYRLPGCADEMVRRALQEVYRDFCRRSCCLRGRRLYDVPRHGDPLIVLPTYRETTIDCVSFVKLSGRTLKPGRDWNFDGRVVHLRHTMPTNRFDRFEAETVEFPVFGSEHPPFGFIRNHGDSVCSGVLARLMSMQGKAWADANEAVIEQRKYENALNEERFRSSEFQNGSGDCYDPSHLL